MADEEVDFDDAEADAAMEETKPAAKGGVQRDNAGRRLKGRGAVGGSSVHEGGFDSIDTKGGGAKGPAKCALAALALPSTAQGSRRGARSNRGLDRVHHGPARGDAGGRHPRQILRLWRDPQSAPQPRPQDRLRQGSATHRRRARAPRAARSLGRRARSLALQGYALVEYATQKEAQGAIDNMNGEALMGANISVDWAFSKGPTRAAR